MTETQPTRRERRLASLAAAGKPIDPNDTSAMRAYKRRQAASDWQPLARSYAEEIPLLGFAHQFIYNAMSRVRMIPALLADDPKDPPVPLTDENCPARVTVAQCIETLGLLEPHPNYMGSTAVNLRISGESYTAILNDDESVTGRECCVLSEQEVDVKGREWKIEDEDYPRGRTIKPDEFLFRQWTGSPRKRNLPWSPMRWLLDACDIYTLQVQHLRGQTRSRLALNNGILFVADEMTLETPTPEDQSDTAAAGDGEGNTDSFIDDFIVAASTAITVPDSVGASIPIIIRGPYAKKDGIVHIDVAKALEEAWAKVRQEFREEIADGIDLPREKVLGVGGTNHWNAEDIDHQTWHVHLEPLALAIVTATTEGFYRPTLRALGVAPEVLRKLCVWYDPTWWVGTPDLAATADKGLDEYAISYAAWRAANGWTDDDAPTEEEIKYRLWIDQQKRRTIRETITPAAGADPALTEPGADQSNLDTGGLDDGPPPDGLTAAASRPLDELGMRLVGIERDLRARFGEIANQQIARGLERAGLKVRNKLQKRDALLSQVASVHASMIPATLGRATVESLGLKDQELLAGALGTLQAQYFTHVRRAQHAATRAAQTAVGGTFDDDAFDLALEPHREAGWKFLAASLTALALSLLYDPHPAAPAVGEFDETTVVPSRLIRRALDIAGGTNIPAGVQIGDSVPVGGGATQGPSVLDEFKTQLGIIEDSYTWVYGDTPRREFPPHNALDGVTFATFDAAVLANSESFPDADHYQPDDHNGCLCDVAVTFTQADELTAAAVPKG